MAVKDCSAKPLYAVICEPLCLQFELVLVVLMHILSVVLCSILLNIYLPIISPCDVMEWILMEIVHTGMHWVNLVLESITHSSTTNPVINWCLVLSQQIHG